MPPSPGGLSCASASRSARSASFSAEARSSLGSKPLQVSFLTESGAALSDRPARDFLPASSSAQLHDAVAAADGDVRSDTDLRSDVDVVTSTASLRRKGSTPNGKPKPKGWRLGPRRNTERKLNVNPPSAGMAKLAASKSMPDAVGYSSDAEAKARAQFARSRNTARIWGASRSGGCLSAELGPPTFDEAVAALARTAKDGSGPGAMEGMAVAIGGGRKGVLKAAAKVFRDAERSGPPPRWRPQVAQGKSVHPPRADVGSKTIDFSVGLPLAESVALTTALLASAGEVSAQRARRGRASVSVKLEKRVSATATIRERAAGKAGADVKVVCDRSVRFSSRQRDRFAEFGKGIAQVWASVGIPAKEAAKTTGSAGGGGSGGTGGSSRRLRPSGPSWRRRNTALV